jgi:predicted lactoylglutathione lyase
MPPADARVPALLTVVTLGARDQSRLVGFYKGLGWETVADLADFTAFRLRGALLAVFPIGSLADDAHAQPAAHQPGLRGFTMAMNVGARDEVDAVIAAVRERGGRITKEPVDAELFDGRTAYFADPEENYWEVVWLAPGGPVSEAVATVRGD